jgi:hypothetical protein
MSEVMYLKIIVDEVPIDEIPIEITEPEVEFVDPSTDSGGGGGGGEESGGDSSAAPTTPTTEATPTTETAETTPDTEVPPARGESTNVGDPDKEATSSPDPFWKVEDGVIYIRRGPDGWRRWLGPFGDDLSPPHPIGLPREDGVYGEHGEVISEETVNEGLPAEGEEDVAEEESVIDVGGNTQVDPAVVLPEVVTPVPEVVTPVPEVVTPVPEVVTETPEAVDPLEEVVEEVSVGDIIDEDVVDIGGAADGGGAGTDGDGVDTGDGGEAGGGDSTGVADGSGAGAGEGTGEGSGTGEGTGTVKQSLFQGMV